jgi:hypothetical protein
MLHYSSILASGDDEVEMKQMRKNKSNQLSALLDDSQTAYLDDYKVLYGVGGGSRSCYENPFAPLDVDTVASILQFLPIITFLSMRQVCHYLRQIASKRASFSRDYVVSINRCPNNALIKLLPNIGSFNISGGKNLTNLELTAFFKQIRLNNIVNLNLSGLNSVWIEIHSSLLPLMAECRNLRSLSTPGSPEWNKRAFQYLADSSNFDSSLTDLTIGSQQNLHTAPYSRDKEFMTIIKSFKKINRLSLEKASGFNNSSLEELDELQLVSLNLSDCYEITERGIRHLVSHQFILAELNLSNCSGVNNVAINFIAHTYVNTLTSLSLAKQANIDDTGLLYLSHMKKLRSLSLHTLRYISATGLSSLAKGAAGKSLRILSIQYCGAMDNAWCASIARICGLEELLLASHDEIGLNLTDNAFRWWNFIKKAEYKNKLALAINDQGVFELCKQLKQLRKLQLNGFPLSDDIFLYLNSLTKLQSLHLMNCNFLTMIGLKNLINNHNLTRLHLEYCKNLNLRDEHGVDIDPGKIEVLFNEILHPQATLFISRNEIFMPPNPLSMIIDSIQGEKNKYYRGGCSECERRRMNHRATVRTSLVSATNSIDNLAKLSLNTSISDNSSTCIIS